MVLQLNFILERFQITKLRRRNNKNGNKFTLKKNISALKRKKSNLWSYMGENSDRILEAINSFIRGSVKIKVAANFLANFYLQKCWKFFTFWQFVKIVNVRIAEM